MNGSLRGLRVVVTRPRSQAPPMCRLLTERGAIPLIFPTIEIVPPADPGPLDDALARLDDYDWVVFTSVNGVEAFFARAVRSAWPGSLRVAAIGPATAGALEEYGVVASAVPEEYVAERIADAVGDVSGRRFLLARAARARKDLARLLHEQGAAVDDVAAYDTVAGSPTREEFHALRQGADVVTFTSSSTVEHYLELVPDAATLEPEPLVACIGPITASTARARGLGVTVVATTYTTVGLVDALDDHYEGAETLSR